MKHLKPLGFIMFALILLTSVFVLPALSAEEIKTININTATTDQLMELKGVGEKVAARIVEYRKAHGPFEHPIDLMNVKGIGPKLYERNKDLISVGQKKEKSS